MRWTKAGSKNYNKEISVELLRSSVVMLTDNTSNNQTAYRDRFARTSARNSNHITTLQSDRPADGLNRCRSGVPTLLDALMDEFREANLVKTVDRFGTILSPNGDLVLCVESSNIGLVERGKFIIPSFILTLENELTIGRWLTLGAST